MRFLIDVAGRVWICWAGIRRVHRATSHVGKVVRHVIRHRAGHRFSHRAARAIVATLVCAPLAGGGIALLAPPLLRAGRNAVSPSGAGSSPPAVPEPSSALLLGAGVALLLGAISRRR